MPASPDRRERGDTRDIAQVSPSERTYWRLTMSPNHSRLDWKVNLRQALQVLDTISSLKVTSTPALAASVNNLSSGPVGDLVPVPHLNTTLLLRPVDVLLALTTGTRALIEPDVLVAYESWAQWRYLGAFDGGVKHNPMRLSSAGDAVRGNQRRVMSEELGIGFSIKIAEHWMNQKADPRVIVRTVDVDAAIADTDQVSALVGHQITLGRASNQRPDYFVIADDPDSLTKFSLGTLESKGTTARMNLSQLSSANHQLKGITVNGSVLPGLAAGTMLNGAGVTSNALQLPTSPTLDAIPKLRAIEVDLDSLASRRTRRGQPSKGVEESLITASLSASWARLGDVSGNEAVFEAWASADAKRHRKHVGMTQRSEKRDEGSGLGYVGTEVRIPVRGGRLTVFTGIESELADALNGGDAEKILRLQRSNKPRAAAREHDQEGATLLAHSHDGSVIILEAEFAN